MERELDIEYNIQNIKLFLNIFDLEIEERSEYHKGDSLLIFHNDIGVGKVSFEKDCIRMDAQSIYGRVCATTEYAHAFMLTDVESYQTINTLGLYASWNNCFDFSLDGFNNSQLEGSVFFAVKIDNEFGNLVSCHCTLDYQDGGKKYNIILQRDGFPFRFIETRGNYREEIVYNIFNTWGTASYFHHTIKDRFSDGKTLFDYSKGAFIGENYGNKNQNVAICYTDFGDKRMHHSYQEFDRISRDDEDSKEVLNRIHAMNFLDSSMREKLNQVMDEFSINGHSFLETMILYSFTNYSYEEVDALFGLDKGGVNLEKTYFQYTDAKTIGSKIFGSK